MEQYQINENERFFIRLLDTLIEGGVWVWTDNRYIYEKKNNKLVGNEKSINEVKKIVSDKFFKEYFSIK